MNKTRLVSTISMFLTTLTRLIMLLPCYCNFTVWPERHWQRISPANVYCKAWHNEMGGDFEQVSKCSIKFWFFSYLFSKIKAKSTALSFSKLISYIHSQNRQTISIFHCDYAAHIWEDLSYSNWVCLVLNLLCTIKLYPAVLIIKQW